MTFRADASTPSSAPTATEVRALASQGISGGAPLYAWAVRGLEPHLQRARAVLDLGCGQGRFGGYLHERFQLQPDGCDVVRHAGFLQQHYASFELRNLETVESTGRRYDAIFAIGLIEYFPNPRAFLQSLPPLLAPGGKVVLTSPNPASLLSLLSLARRGEFSAFREVSNPASITPVLAVDAVRMLREAGFTSIAVDYSGRGRVPFFRGLRYQQLLPLLRGRWWSDNFRAVASLD